MIQKILDTYIQDEAFTCSFNNYKSGFIKNIPLNYYDLNNNHIALSSTPDSTNDKDIIIALHEIGHYKDFQSGNKKFTLGLHIAVGLLGSPVMIANIALIGFLFISPYFLPLLVYNILGMLLTIYVEFIADYFVIKNVEEFGVSKKKAVSQMFANTGMYVFITINLILALFVKLM